VAGGGSGGGWGGGGLPARRSWFRRRGTAKTMRGESEAAVEDDHEIEWDRNEIA